MKPYMKPTIDLIELRTEERFAWTSALDGTINNGNVTFTEENVQGFNGNDLLKGIQNFLNSLFK